MRVKTIGVKVEDYLQLIDVAIALAVERGRPVSIRETFGIVVKHYKGCRGKTL